MSDKGIKATLIQPRWSQDYPVACPRNRLWPKTSDLGSTVSLDCIIAIIIFVYCHVTIVLPVMWFAFHVTMCALNLNCCCYCFVRNSQVPLLEALRAQFFFWNWDLLWFACHVTLVILLLYPTFLQENSHNVGKFRSHVCVSRKQNDNRLYFTLLSFQTCDPASFEDGISKMRSCVVWNQSSRL